MLFDNDNLFSNKIAYSKNHEQLLKDLLEASEEEDKLYEGICTDVIILESDMKGEYSSNWSKFKYISKHVNRYFDISQNSIESWHPPQDGLEQNGKNKLYFQSIKGILKK